MFIFDMLSVKALITCDNARENVRDQLLIKRSKLAFLIAYWIVFLSLLVMFFQAYLRGLRFKEITDPYIIVMW